MSALALQICISYPFEKQKSCYFFFGRVHSSLLPYSNPFFSPTFYFILSSCRDVKLVGYFAKIIHSTLHVYNAGGIGNIVDMHVHYYHSRENPIFATSIDLFSLATA